MKPRVDFAKFKEALIAEIMDFCRFAHFRKTLIFLKSASHFHHNFTMLLFDNQKRVNLRHKLIKGFSRKLYVKNSFFKFSSAICASVLGVISSVKSLGNPIHDIFIGIRNFDVSMIISGNVSSGRFCIKNADEKTAFSINKTCKISQISFCVHNHHCLRLLNHKQKAILCLR